MHKKVAHPYEIQNITYKSYSGLNPTFSDRVTIIRLLIGPSSSIRLLIDRQLDHFQKS